jgi:diguanylate cyclase (GGDEF)-like protein
VNDTHGHAAGDAVLRHIAAVMKACVRTSDLLARYGGEEFCVVLRDTDAEGARLFAERARASLASAPAVADELSIPVTASFGVAALGAGDTVEAVLKRADEALYAAKRTGRDRVATELPALPLAS